MSRITTSFSFSRLWGVQMIKLGKAPQVSRELLGDKVADVLRYQIITGEMADGDRLVELDVATRLGVSRATLREALTTLEHEGLVASTPGQGTYIRALTEERVHQLYDLRAVLEVHAIKLAAEQINNEQVDELNALLVAMTQSVRLGVISEFVSIDLQIHSLIWEISDNEFLVRALEYPHSLSKALVYLNAENYTDWPRVVELHQYLVDAITSGNKKAAALRMQEHLEDSQQKALLALQHKSLRSFSENKAASDGHRLVGADFGREDLVP